MIQPRVYAVPAPAPIPAGRLPVALAAVSPGLPQVTVAIACYNQAHYLAEAVESVQAQSYPAAEIVVVDDGSTDLTRDVAACYPGVRYIYQRNQGLSAARNTGLAAARGEYVVFLDADDRLLPRALEIGVTCMAAHPECGFVSGHFRYIKAGGDFLGEYPQRRIFHDHYLALLRGNYIGMHAAVMYRREVVAAVGGFDTSLPACEDYDLYLRVARTHPVFCHDEVIAEYRQHGSNMSGDPHLMLRQVRQVLDRQRPHLATETHKRAYRAGRLAWQAHYGRKFFERAAQLRRQGKLRASVPALLPVLWNAPLYAAYHTVEWLWGRGYDLLYRMLTPGARQALARQLYHLRAPRTGSVRLGDLGAAVPQPAAGDTPPALWVDRHYQATFLADNAHYLRGQVLLLDRPETWAEHVGPRLHDVRQLPAPPHDELRDDLDAAAELGDASFDCIVGFQTLHRVYDLRGALHTLYQRLAPGGVLLVTLPGVGLVKATADAEAGYWAVTEYAARELLGAVFPPDLVKVTTQGNVLAAQAQLHGLPAACLRADELEVSDPQYPLVVTVRAIKPHPGARLS